MLISFVIPCFNENLRLKNSYKLLNNYFNNVDYNFEIIFVDDWSKDVTKKKLDDYKKKSEFNIKIISYKKNKWKWFAVKTWIKEARWNYIFMMDADIATDMNEIDKFLKIKDNYDILVWSRKTKTAKRSFIRKFLWNISYILIRTILWINIKDTQCWFKMFNRKSLFIFDLQKIDWFGFDFEILYLANKNKLKVKEIKVSRIERKGWSVGFIDYIKVFCELLKVKKIHKNI
jgi:dolichyl-phosphate beta-glucosyltransferase